MKATEKFGKQNYSVLFKSLEFCRILYGSEYSKLVILIFFVCQCCGFSPAHDFDWWFIAKGNLKGWYCGKCGCNCVSNFIAGAVAILHKACRDLCVMTRIVIPTGKAANVFSLLKCLNILRTGNLMLAEDALHNVELLLCEINAMILRDSATAS